VKQFVSDPVFPLTGPAVKKIAVFVAAQNIYYTTRQAYGRQFNYRKLRQLTSSEGEIFCATFMTMYRLTEW
jgi:uncharacterized LabA/DUF88 family protein